MKRQTQLAKSVGQLFFLLSFLLNIVTAFQITGISAGVDQSTGQRPLRQEINQFATSGAAFDLFILAFGQFQTANQSDLLSYFQVSGIHGYPHIPWDGVAGSYGYPGFCMHASVPFPTWHRPYVALYEQVLWSYAQNIAQQYPISQQNDYISAATTLRVPYWDWAAQPDLPDVVASPTIKINTPDRGYTTVNNPLYQYNFQSDAAGNGFPPGNDIAELPETVRHWDGSQSDQSACNATLLSQAASILSLTYQMFTLATNYDAFSCTNPGGGSGSGYNIEGIHNSIHNSVGGNGHMTYPELAAFDPIFWLHHANVDRLFAMWQTQFPNSYIEPTVNTYGSYYEPVGAIDSGNSSLAPFHSDNGTTLYTSDDVQGTLRFGYTYPEIIDWNVSQSELAVNVRQEINRLYNNAAFAGGSTNTSSSRKRAIDSTDVSMAFNHVTYDLAKSLGVNNVDMQWSIGIDLERFAYNSAFVIDFFMGTPPADTRTWATAPNLIGSHAQFIAGNVSSMHPDGVPSGRVLGEVSLTHTIAAGVARGILQDMQPSSVVPLLIDQLNWRARSPDSSEIDLTLLTGLTITVKSQQVTPAISGTAFPTYGEIQTYPLVTKGKIGGVA